nr:hypothetical protein [Flavobacterium sp.]
MENLEGGLCSGQSVMDCVTDVYSNHGWASITVGVVSAFIPQTFVVYAVACATRSGC